jgi:hypothetical protein
VRLLAITIITGLALTGCASAQGTLDSGSDPKGGMAAPSQSPGDIDPGWSGGGSGSSGSGGIGTGGSGTAGTGTAPSGTAGGRPTGSHTDPCPAQLDEGQHNSKDAKPLPNDIVVDWVLRCMVTSPVDGDRYLLIERSDSDPTALLAALRAPDEPPSSGACPAIAMVVPYFALVQPDGTPLVPRIPVTSCRLPQAAVLKALNAMTFVVTSRKQLP